MKALEFRTLTKKEVQVRVASISEYGAILTLYKNARVDQQLLDEAVGPFGWKREHREVVVGDEIRQSCTVSIWDDEKNQWISKEDFGSSDFTFEIPKAAASDSFKRACTNWGIGRELYSAPDIILGTEDYYSKVAPNGKISTYDEFVIDEFECNEERIISKLVIKNVNKNKIVFSYDIDSGVHKADVTTETDEKKVEKVETNPSSPSNTGNVVNRPVTHQTSEEPARCDVGGSCIYGKLLSDLKPNELVYCFKNTKKQMNKNVALYIAREKPLYAEAFKAAGIEV